MEKDDTEKYFYDSVRNLTGYLSKQLEKKGDNLEDSSKENWMEDLKEIADIYRSSDCIYGKISKMRDIYRTPEDFLRSLRFHIRRNKDSIPFQMLRELDDAYTLYNDFFEESLNVVSYYKKFESYFRAYKYADFIVSSYVLEDEIKNTYSWLDKFGIDIKDFNYCVYIVEELNPDLYDKYKSKNASNSMARAADTKSRLVEIVNGIKNGYLSDGREFNMAEFFRLLPFSDMNCSKEVLTDYNVVLSGGISARLKNLVNVVLPEYYKLLVDYVAKNKLTDLSFRPVSTESIYKTNVIIGDRTLNDSEKTKILTYMEENSIPMVEKAYAACKSLYLEGKIKGSDSKVKRYTPKQKFTIIP